MLCTHQAFVEIHISLPWIQSGKTYTWYKYEIWFPFYRKFGFRRPNLHIPQEEWHQSSSLMRASSATHASSWTASGGTFGRSQKGLAGAAHGGGAARHGRSESRAATCLRSQHRPRAPAPGARCSRLLRHAAAQLRPVQTFCPRPTTVRARHTRLVSAPLDTCVRWDIWRRRKEPLGRKYVKKKLAQKVREATLWSTRSCVIPHACLMTLSGRDY